MQHIEFFHIDHFETRIKDLFENEEVMERLSLISEHPKFVKNTLGNEPKLYYEDWIDERHKIYDLK